MAAGVVVPSGLLACSSGSGVGGGADGGTTSRGDSGANSGGPEAGIGGGGPPNVDASSGSVDSGGGGASDAGAKDAAAPQADASLPPTSGDSGTTFGDASVSYTLKFVPGSNYLLYATIGGGTPHQIQLDTGSNGTYVPKSVVGSSAQISATDTCTVTYSSSGNTLSGHKATGPITLLGSTAAGDLASSPTTVPMSFCAVDDTTWSGGMMGVGFGRAVSDLTQNVLLQMADIHSGAMHPGYVLSTRPTPNVQIGITAARSAHFQTIALSPSTTGNGDWVAKSLQGCVSLPNTPAFKQECGGLLVDTGVGETILWGPTDPTLGGIVASGATAAPNGTAVTITTVAGPMVNWSYVLGTGADTPTAVNIKTAGGFSINTGRALIVDYDYLFDSAAGLVGFQRM